jgi:hypothetical protein
LLNENTKSNFEGTGQFLQTYRTKIDKFEPANNEKLGLFKNHGGLSSLVEIESL